MLIFSRDKLGPWLFGVSAKDSIEMRIQLQIIRVEVMKELFCPQDFGNLD
jgi:hypothetical protein